PCPASRCRPERQDVGPSGAPAHGPVGKVPLRGNVNKTAAERGADKSTNEYKAD
ncbi:unnamed protein product, partial [Ectocarpus fasciculatus]